MNRNNRIDEDNEYNEFGNEAADEEYFDGEENQEGMNEDGDEHGEYDDREEDPADGQGNQEESEQPAGGNQEDEEEDFPEYANEHNKQLNQIVRKIV